MTWVSAVHADVVAVRERARPHPLVYAVLGCGASALVVTLAAAVPKGLPAIALGSTAVLHAVRAAVVVWLLYALIVVVAAAWNGRLATEVSGTGAKFAEVADVTADELTSLNLGLDSLYAETKASFERLAERVDRLEADLRSSEARD